MTSVEAIPACLLAAPTVTQPPHLEGDPALATEILPGPPPLASVQQHGQPKKDHKKVPLAVSYLPTSDPGTTYGANTVSTMAAVAEVDGPRRKRARLEKGYVLAHLWHAHADLGLLHIPSCYLTVAVPNYCRSYPLPPRRRRRMRSAIFDRPKPCPPPCRTALLRPLRSASSRAQRASARNMSAAAPPSDPPALVEAVASSSSMIPDADVLALQVDSDDNMKSRSNSVQLGDEGEQISSMRHSAIRRDPKGKGKERAGQVRVKEEPSTVSLSTHDAPSNQTVSKSCVISAYIVQCHSSRMKTTVLLVALLALWSTVMAAPVPIICGVWTHQWTQQRYLLAMPDGFAPPAY